MTVFEKIARDEGVSVDTVRSEISKALEIAAKNAGPAEKKKWKEIFGDNKSPSPEDAVKLISQHILLHLKK